MKSAIEIARELVRSGKYLEIPGKNNRSLAIDALCREFGYPLGSAWCALFASKCFKLAKESGAEGDPFPYTAGSQAMLAWFKKHGLASKDPQVLLEWKGALIIRTNPDGKHGHVALVEKRFTDHGKVLAVGTLEGNTNAAGDSYGDGAMALRREIPLKPYTWHFCNTSELAGGAWWR